MPTQKFYNSQWMKARGVGLWRHKQEPNAEISERWTGEGTGEDEDGKCNLFYRLKVGERPGCVARPVEDFSTLIAAMKAAQSWIDYPPGTQEECDAFAKKVRGILAGENVP